MRTDVLSNLNGRGAIVKTALAVMMVGGFVFYQSIYNWQSFYAGWRNAFPSANWLKDEIKFQNNAFLIAVALVGIGGKLCWDSWNAPTAVTAAPYGLNFGYVPPQPPGDDGSTYPASPASPPPASSDTYTGLTDDERSAIRMGAGSPYDHHELRDDPYGVKLYRRDSHGYATP